MKKIGLSLISLTLLLVTSCTLKYEVLKGTTLPNPPNQPIKIYIKEFPVESKASVVDPRVSSSNIEQGQHYVTNELAKTGNKLVRISRPSRIEDLSGSVLRELRKEKVRIFSQLEYIQDLGEDSVREIRNPFELVATADEAELVISGNALILSQKVRKIYSQKTQSVEIQVEVKEISTDKTHAKSPVNAGVVMIFNSRELEESMAIAVVTSLTQKLLF